MVVLSTRTRSPWCGRSPARANLGYSFLMPTLMFVAISTATAINLPTAAGWRSTIIWAAQTRAHACEFKLTNWSVPGDWSRWVFMGSEHGSVAGYNGIAMTSEVEAY